MVDGISRKNAPMTLFIVEAVIYPGLVHIRDHFILNYIEPYNNKLLDQP